MVVGGDNTHTILRTTKMALNDLILINSGENALTQQSTGMGERVLTVDDCH